MTQKIILHGEPAILKTITSWLEQGIVDGMFFLGNIFFVHKQTYFKMILQVLLLVTKQTKPIRWLLTAVHSFVCCCPFLHSLVLELPFSSFLLKGVVSMIY